MSKTEAPSENLVSQRGSLTRSVSSSVRVYRSFVALSRRTSSDFFLPNHSSELSKASLMRKFWREMMFWCAICTSLFSSFCSSMGNLRLTSYLSALPSSSRLLLGQCSTSGSIKKGGRLVSFLRSGTETLPLSRQFLRPAVSTEFQSMSDSSRGMMSLAMTFIVSNVSKMCGCRGVGYRGCILLYRGGLSLSSF